MTEKFKKHMAHIASIIQEKTNAKTYEGKKWKGEIYITVNVYEGGITGTECYAKENYGRKAVAHLPEIQVVGAEDPVIQVVEEKSGGVVYTIRINGTSWRPKVFTEGLYTVKVGEGDAVKEFNGVRAEAGDGAGTVEVKF